MQMVPRVQLHEVVKGDALDDMRRVFSDQKIGVRVVMLSGSYLLPRESSSRGALDPVDIELAGSELPFRFLKAGPTSQEAFFRGALEIMRAQSLTSLEIEVSWSRSTQKIIRVSVDQKRLRLETV